MRRHFLVFDRSLRQPPSNPRITLSTGRFQLHNKKQERLFVLLYLSVCMASVVAALQRTTGKAIMRAGVTPTVTEVTLQCSDGVTLAGQRWRAAGSEFNGSDDQSSRLLCLHGWMDNCRTFYQLAPAIVQAQPNVDLVALDLPGHGLSSHKGIDGPPALLAELAYYVSCNVRCSESACSGSKTVSHMFPQVAEAIHQLGWASPDGATKSQPDGEDSPSITLIGHSMGAGIGCLYSAAFPEQIARLVLIEGAGPLAREATHVSQHVRNHIRRRLVGNQADTAKKQPRIYPSLEKAVETRCFTAKNFPGNQWLSTEAATEMVLRATYAVGDQGEVQFRHDPRLQWPSIQYFTQEQVESLYDNISCPTALLLAEDGWPFDNERFQSTLDKLQPAVYHRLPGSHHFHADPDSSAMVADKVIDFLSM